MEKLFVSLMHAAELTGSAVVSNGKVNGKACL